MRKFEIYKYQPDRIRECEVEKESNSFLWINGRRVAKSTEFHRFFDTWAEAKQALLDSQEAQIEAANSKIRLATEARERIQELKCPAEPGYRAIKYV